ncbi:DUF134 domain-containing protein [Candidatus Gracilibacteria bacterium]|nr:DUF134 domain-containing protein [Candidatus Gracilibacteria bacterium]
MNGFGKKGGFGCGNGRGRRKKQRCIDFQSEIEIFKPVGVPLSKLNQVVLEKDELETLRLKNIEGMDIVQGAEKMVISKSTFARVYNSAVNKITDALINGKVIRIEN